MTTKTSSKKRAAKPAATKAKALAAPRVKGAIVVGDDMRFAEVIALIETARARWYQALNTVLAEHYCEIGAYISGKFARSEWGDGVVKELAADLARRYPGVRGYTRPNLFRMRQFYEAYRADRKVSALLRQLPWTHHLLILGQAKPVEAREFYILAAIKERWTSRELERQLRSGAVLRDAQTAKKVSPALRQIHPTAIDEFKNAYNVEFLGLAAEHSEADLHGTLLRSLGSHKAPVANFAAERFTSRPSRSDPRGFRVLPGKPRLSRAARVATVLSRELADDQRVPGSSGAHWAPARRVPSLWARSPATVHSP